MALSGEISVLYLKSHLVNQKYEPFLNVQLNQGDANQCVKMITTRAKALKTLNIDLYNIKFIGDDLNTLADSQNDARMLSPIAVISSNRSKWIKKTYEVGELLSQTEGGFTNLRDRKALKKGPVPIYAPYRFDPGERNYRRVYIFVQIKEFSEYKKNLADTEFHVVGWEIKGQVPMVGFGASRFAAMEFFKNIYNEKGTLSKVWMFDDNTCFIRKFPTLEKVEKAMENKKNCTGLGFKGGSGGLPEIKFTQLIDEPAINDEITTDISGTTILQQSVLWNLAAFKKGEINFSPFFFSAGEDVSFTLYIKQKAALFYSGAKILKSAVGLKDNEKGVILVNEYKEKIADAFFKLAADAKPIPITVKDIKAKNLAGVIEQVPAVLNAGDTFENTYSRAVEQIIKVAMGKITISNLSTAFKFSKPFTVTIINTKN